MPLCQLGAETLNSTHRYFSLFRFSAHRFFCAAEILRRAAALNDLFLGGPPSFAAGLRPRRLCISLILSSILFFSISYPTSAICRVIASLPGFLPRRAMISPCTLYHSITLVVSR